MPTLDVEKFHKAEFDNPPLRIIVTGKTNTGKSFYVEHGILRYMKHSLDRLYIICPTSTEEDFAHLTKKKRIFTEYDPMIIQIIIAKQKKRRDKKKPPLSVMVWLDDLAGMVNKNDPMIKALFTQGRHYDISVIFVTQKFNLTDSSLRVNADYIICTQVNSAKEIKSIRDEYSMSIQRSVFEDMLRNVTMDNGVLIINNKSKKGEQYYFYDKASSKHDDFYIENDEEK